MGKVRKEFTSNEWEKIELYMKSGATQKRIAESFGMEPDTLRARLQEKYGDSYHNINESFRRSGELLIEATQFQKALQGNVQLLIWLGKVRCGQKDPDHASILPPNQNNIDKDHLIMRLQHQLDSLKKNEDKNVSVSERETE